MYNQQYKFKFIDTIKHSERMRYLVGLLELPNNGPLEEKSIYSYTIKHNGIVTLSSSHPDTSKSIENWLIEHENNNVISKL